MNPRSLAFASILLSAAHASAQAPSRTSTAYLAAGNTDYSSTLYGYGADYSGTGDYVALDQAKTWSGWNSDYDWIDMTFDARVTAQSNYGQLKTSVDARLANTIYNWDNVPYYTGQPNEDPNDDGVADKVLAAGIASFSDRLAFGGGAFTGYKARYTFYIHGSTTGTNVSANLRCSIAGNIAEQYDVDFSSGTIGQYWTTKAYDVGASFEQTANVQFTTRFDANAQDYADGETVEGTGLFSSTVTLTAVLLYDQNDNLVSRYTVTGASGTSYPINPVPEPASMAVMVLGVGAYLRRRRQG